MGRKAEEVGRAGPGRLRGEESGRRQEGLAGRRGPEKSGFATGMPWGNCGSGAEERNSDCRRGIGMEIVPCERRGRESWGCRRAG